MLSLSILSCRLIMDPASRKLFQFGIIGLVMASAVVAGFELRPVGVFSAYGTLVLEISSAPPDISSPPSVCKSCEVESLTVTVESVWAHRTGILNTEGEWVQVLSTKTFDLTHMVNVNELLGSSSIPPGEITQVRMNVTQAVARFSESSDPVTLDIPSGNLKINLQSALVKAGMTTTIVLEINPHIVCQGNEQCKLTPVLRVARVTGPS